MSHHGHTHNTHALSGIVPRDLAGRAAALSLVANFGLMIMKITVGLISGSVAVLSDGIDSAQDMIAAAIAFASVRLGARPADIEHPYGHGRAETVAAGIQGLLIAGGGVFIVYRAVYRLLEPPDHIDADIGLIAMLIAAGVNLGVGRYAARVAKQTGSPAIASDAKHLITNVVQAGAVLAGLGLVLATGETAFDSLVALALGCYLLWIAASILWSSLGDVLDVSLTEAEVKQVEQAILAERDAIHGFHRLRTRRSGQSRHVDFHLLLPPNMTMADAHLITDRIEDRIEALWPGTVVTIHMEPADGRWRGPMEDEAASRGREGEAREA
jgi:cation diffusion facilitator family transporter